MAFKDVVKVNRRTFFNPRAWFDYDRVKAQTVFIFGLIKQLFVIPQPTHQETFEEALVRFNLTDAEIQERGEQFLNYCIIFATLAACLLIFSFYLLIFSGSIAGWMIGVSACALLLTQAFRYHFWYFQIKNRKLGCTLAEWKQGKINDHEEPPT